MLKKKLPVTIVGVLVIIFSLSFIAPEKVSADGLLDYSVRSQFDSSVVLKARTKYTSWWGTVTNSASTDIIECRPQEHVSEYLIALERSAKILAGAHLPLLIQK